MLACWHVESALKLSGCETSPSAGEAEDTTAVYACIKDVALLHNTVHMLNDGSGCVTEAVFSGCQPKQGWPRTTVGANKHGILTCCDVRCCKRSGLKFRCHHFQAVAEWMLDTKSVKTAVSHSAGE